MKLAIVCDWLTGVGGAERVVYEVHRMFPDAPIYTSQYDPQSLDWFKDADVRTGWLNKVPIGLKKFLPLLRAWYFSHLDLSGYDVVLSINFGAESKAVKFGPETVHICYCNAPTHYYWSRYDDYLKNPGFPKGFNWLACLMLKLLVGPLRRWDFKAAQKPTHLIANSSHIQREIKKYYKRDSTVIHPPVNTERFSLSGKKAGYFLAVGRQTPYKRIDLAVEACTALGLPLVVIGTGPDAAKLKALAGPTVEFKGFLSDEDIVRYFAEAKAFIFPNLDDFGITPVEAMAAGTPVLAFKAGGALDYVRPGVSGEFFTEQTVDSLMAALRSFDTATYKPAGVQKEAEKFSVPVFRRKIQRFMRGAI